MKLASPQRFAAASIAVAALLAPGGAAQAAPVFQSTTSTAMFRHDPDVGVAGVPALSGNFVATANYSLAGKTNPKTFTPTATVPSPPSYQFATRQTLANSQSTLATASVSHVTNATTAGVKLGAGTGVSQVNRGGYLGASSLRIDVDFWWTNNTSAFGPPANGLANIVVGGSVGANPGSFAAFDAVLRFQNPDGTAAPDYRAPVDFHDAWVRGDADVNATTGAFSKSFSTTALLQPPSNQLLPGQRLRVTGFIEFRVFNGTTQVASLAAEPTGDAFALTDSLLDPAARGGDDHPNNNDPHKNQNGKGHEEHGNGYGYGHTCEHGRDRDECEEPHPPLDSTLVFFPEEVLIGGSLPTIVPEPTAATLLGAGVATLVLRRRERR